MRGFYRSRTANSLPRGKRRRQPEQKQDGQTRRRAARQVASSTVTNPALEERPQLKHATQSSEPSEPLFTNVSTNATLMRIPETVEPSSFVLKKADGTTLDYPIIQTRHGPAVYPTEWLPIPRDSKGTDFTSDVDATPNPSTRSSSPGLHGAVNNLSSYSTSHKDDVIDAISCSFRSSSISKERTSIGTPGLHGRESRSIGCKTATAREQKAHGKCKLPGTFITPRFNTLLDHVGCTASEPAHNLQEWCKYCCWENPWVEPPSKRAIGSYTIIQGKRYGQTRPEGNFRATDLTWSDKFDNTALHAAAAMGPTYHILEYIIDQGADLNAVNTAGQTFMHVLDPQELRKDIATLLVLIQGRGFDFGITDHLGQTIFHELSRKKPCLVRSKFWTPERLRQRDSSGRSVWDDISFSKLGKKRSTEACPERFVFAAYGIGSVCPSAEIPQRDDLPHTTQMLINIREADSDCTRMDDKVDEYGRNALHLLADIQFDLRTTVCNDSAEG